MSFPETSRQVVLVSYTIFPDVTPLTKVERSDVEWSHLVENIRRAPTYLNKSSCPLISIAEYGDRRTEKGCLRHAANVLRVYGVELDYDGEKMPIEEAAALLQRANIESVLYTSPSHTPTRPRWRVLMPLSEPAPPDRRAVYVGRANRLLGGIASRESFTLSQSFYLGRVRGAEYVVIETVGRSVDLAAELEPQYYVGASNDGESSRDVTTDEQLRAAFIRGEDRYNAMLKLSSRWAARGMPQDDIEAALNELLNKLTSSKNGDGIDLRSRVRPLAQSAVRKFGDTRAIQLSMMVTQACEIDEPKEVLLDIAAQDVVEMLREYRARQAKYVTAPFDYEGRKIRFFPGGYSVWSGFPGAGKTTILRQAICQWLNGGEGVFVASLEEDPRALLIRLAGTAFGVEEPTENQLRWFCDYYAGQLHIWGVIGAGNHRRILGAAQSLLSKGVTQVVIDSLMCLDIDSQGWEIQRKFARLLATFAQTSNVHLHLVAHPKKPTDSENDVHITDVGGSKDIVGAADNVLFIRRGQEQDNGDNCGMKVSIRKQRHFTGSQGEIVGWFNRRLRQFKSDQFDQHPTQYLPKEAYE
jgi:hypothetical protein